MTIPDTTPRKNLVKTLVPVAVILAVVISVLLFVKFKGNGPSPSSNISENSTAPNGAPMPAPSVGTVLPDFELAGVPGVSETKSAKISDIHAKVILINFWATWCEACMEEMPSIVELREAYKDKGFEVIGMNLDENAETVVPRAVKQLKMAFPLFQDPQNKLAEYFDVHAIPLSVLINKDRKILFLENGERNWNDQETRQMLDHWISSN